MGSTPFARKPLGFFYDARRLCTNPAVLPKEVANGIPPFVLNWGFTPQKMLPLVKETLALGFKPVWFSAERFVARQAFIERGGIDIRYFDQYLKLITAAEADLMAVFGACVIKTLRDDATRMKPEDIYACIFCTRATSGTGFPLRAYFASPA